MNTIDVKLESINTEIDVNLEKSYAYAEIPEGYYKIEGTTEITENGTHNVGNYEFAEVNVPERKEEQEATVNITKNGTTEIFPDENKVLSKATVNVNVPIPDGYIKPEGSMPITENGTFDVTEKAEVNVQVVAKPEKPYIDSSKLKSGAYMFQNSYGTDLSLLKNLDTSEMKSMQSMFQGRKDLTGAFELDTGNVENFEYMCGDTNITSLKINASNGGDMRRLCIACYEIIDVELGDTSKAYYMGSAFQNCKKLKTIKGLKTGNNSNFPAMFFSCEELVELPELDFSKANGDYSQAFYNCKKLTTVKFVGVIAIKNNNFSFAQSPNLTVESLLSILNALSDNMGLATTYTVHLGSANIAKLTFEQLSIAYDKNIDLD